MSIDELIKSGGTVLIEKFLDNSSEGFKTTFLQYVQTKFCDEGYREVGSVVTSSIGSALTELPALVERYSHFKGFEINMLDNEEEQKSLLELNKLISEDDYSICINNTSRRDGFKATIHDGTECIGHVEAENVESALQKSVTFANILKTIDTKASDCVSLAEDNCGVL